MLEGRRIAGLVLFGALAAGCVGADASLVAERSRDITTTTTTAPAVTTSMPAPSTTAPAPTQPAPATTTTSTPPPTTATPTTRRPFVERVVFETGFGPFAVVENLTLSHPAAAVERIGFHESGHDGARQQDVLATAASPMTLETRDRGTPDRTAADIVVSPNTEIRSPVTGIVVRSGAYTLYCDHVDEYLVIEPDDRPGWEVKVFHVVGLQVTKGQRVEAGISMVALHARILPFESQVDEFTAEPSSPHVHIEVVDPTVPDRPDPGGGCP